MSAEPASRLLRLAAVLLGALTPVLAQEQPAPQPASQLAPPLAPEYTRMLQALKPRMTFEVTERNLNAYLLAHPQDFAIPEGFDAPAVAFREGVVEVSAVTRVVFLRARVRVSMIPEIVDGRLRLRVHKIQAGRFPLPPSFHRGAADTIESIINQMLANNELELLCVEIVPGLVRVTAQVRPPPAPNPLTP